MSRDVLGHRIVRSATWRGPGATATDQRSRRNLTGEAALAVNDAVQSCATCYRMCFCGQNWMKLEMSAIQHKRKQGSEATVPHIEFLYSQLDFKMEWSFCSFLGAGDTIDTKK